VGRHSAVEDEEEGEDLLDLLATDRAGDEVAEAPPTSRGRHTRAESDPDPDAAARDPERRSLNGTGQGPDAVVTEPNPAAPQPTVTGQPGNGTRADVRLMRHNRALLARCVAALVVPFVLYTLVLVVIGDVGDVSDPAAGGFRDFFIWLWIPALIAGALLGAFLDAAHRHSHVEPTDTRQPEPQDADDGR
jgi:hypothetical protein